MDNTTIKKKLNKVYEDIGGMVSSAAGLPGIEGGMTKKRKETNNDKLKTVIKDKINRV
jgi:hypothetical protein